MLDLSVLFKRVSKVAADNSPAILTAIGATSAAAAAYLAARAGFKSAEEISVENAARDESIDDYRLTTQEKFDLTWKNYVPAATCVVVSVTSVICANRISDRRAAALASAYSIVEKSYTEYRTKNIEKIGKKKEAEVRAEMAQDRVNAHPPNMSTIIVTGVGATRVRDEWSGRYFTGDIETLRKAQNDFNQTLVNSTHLPLTEFYHLVGLPPTRESDQVGWDTDKLLELEFQGTLHEDGTPCISMDFKVPPNARYSSLY